MSTAPRVVEPYVAGLHFGSPLARAACAIVERVPGAAVADPVRFRLRWLWRWPVGSPYPKIIANMGTILEMKPFVGELAALVVNATSVGSAALELVEGRVTVRIERAWVTAGEVAGESAEGWRVPQRDLIGVVQLLLQQGRLDLPRCLPQTPTLVGQLDAWRVTARLRGRERYELDGEDDLVTALALACWWGHMVNPAQAEADPEELTYQEALAYERNKRRIKPDRAKPGGPTLDSIA